MLSIFFNEMKNFNSNIKDQKQPNNIDKLPPKKSNSIDLEMMLLSSRILRKNPSKKILY